MRADQIHHMDGKNGIHWLAPIVADAEAGFGGTLNAFELMKAMIEAGAACVHFEDQLSSAKKCGHMGGKVLVPTSRSHPEAGRGAAGRRRAGRADAYHGPYRRQQRLPAHQRYRPARPRVRHRRADHRRLLPHSRRHRVRHCARARLRSLCRPDLVRNFRAEPGGGARASPKRSTPSIPASCWPTTVRPRSTGRRSSTMQPSRSFQPELAPWDTSSSSSRWPDSTP